MIVISDNITSIVGGERAQHFTDLHRSPGHKMIQDTWNDSAFAATAVVLEILAIPRSSSYE